VCVCAACVCVWGEGGAGRRVVCWAGRTFCLVKTAASLPLNFASLRRYEETSIDQGSPFAGPKPVMQVQFVALISHGVHVGEDREMTELFPTGIGIHHAGMLRSDRSLMERLFADGLLKVPPSQPSLCTDPCACATCVFVCVRARARARVCFRKRACAPC
jgi:hypothetical protein